MATGRLQTLVLKLEKEKEDATTVTDELKRENAELQQVRSATFAAPVAHSAKGARTLVVAGGGRGRGWGRAGEAKLPDTQTGRILCILALPCTARVVA